MAATPQIVVITTPTEFAANYQGVYAAGTTYQPGQWVESGGLIYTCLQTAVGKTPAGSGEYWLLLGSAT